MTATYMASEAAAQIPHLKNEGENDVCLSVPPISTERARNAALLTSPCNNSNGDDEDDDASSGSASSNHTCSDIQGKSIVVPNHESHFNNLDHLRALEEGGCLFSFVCNHKLSPYEAEMFNNVINLSAFDDETQENYVPHFEYSEEDNESEYTFLLARCAYLYVGVDVRRLLSNPSCLATLEYQRSCQPTGTTVWDDYEKMEPDNFRVTKPIIPYLYDFTIQFRVSGNLSQEALDKLGRHVGFRVDGGILLERTKRSVPPKEDATKKCKSLLLYTDLTDGVFLVTHLTVILQQGLPDIVEKVIDTFGQWGLGETCETAWKTRRYLRRELPAPMRSPGEAFLDAQYSHSVEKQEIPSDSDSNESNEDRFYDVGG